MENNATSTNIQPTSYGPDTIHVGQVWADREGFTYKVSDVGSAGAIVRVQADYVPGETTSSYSFAWEAFARMTLLDAAIDIEEITDLGEPAPLGTPYPPAHWAEPTVAEKLAEAYHLLFDAIEDPALTSRSFRDRIDELDALVHARSALAEAIRIRGENRPERYDGDGRTYENGGLR